MLAVETGPDGQPWFVGFEWIGKRDYLNEGGKSGLRTRGANATSADAIVRFKHEGRVETVLIEWKYTESYGSPIPPKGNEERLRRYKDIVFAPHGPIRNDLGLRIEDFFWDPFYQLLRQQMLAYGMQEAEEDGTQQVRVLHISPSANTAFHKITAPNLRRFADDVFGVFSQLLCEPDRFVSRSTERVFNRPLTSVSGDAGSWAGYLRERYSFLQPAQ